ncbi:hypothetical protein F0562_010222 [Nyssa sinensis]|uniref:Apple domain-containing protein n=1 Tax=Nyssa sinensis TaxID=561372 RepID=A0A5J5A0H3_9ASTE|nr:hypothetical protein F0562_010222 [Nyssa sinensis]
MASRSKGSELNPSKVMIQTVTWKCSNNLFLGIWYKKFPEIIVWVANRENPITDSHGILTISSDGHIVILNGTKSVIWSSNSSRTAQYSVAQLLDSGNLVLRESSNSSTESYIWQSFDFPSDTLLADMKMGWNLKTGLNRFLTSWKSASDPSPGDFIYGIDVIGLPQFVLRKGSEKKYRTGIWNGLRFSGAGVKSTPVSTPTFVSNTDELYYMYKSNGGSMITRFVVNQSGLLQRFVLSEGSSEWTIMSITQTDQCDDYGHCGANGICKINKGPICECLQGFIPKVQKEWDMFDWSSGCTRTPLNCQKGEGFVKLKNVKLPDLLEFWLNENISLKECKAECLKNCSCTAYAKSDIRGRGSGCLIWFGDLVDIREFTYGDGEQDIFIRMPASELDHNQKGKRLVLIIIISTISGILVLSFLTWCMIWKKRTKRGQETDKEDIELPFFDMVTIAAATKNLSCTNMIGEGGFGPVYKVA